LPLSVLALFPCWHSKEDYSRNAKINVTMALEVIDDNNGSSIKTIALIADIVKLPKTTML
jgi:hypothetical protein